MKREMKGLKPEQICVLVQASDRKEYEYIYDGVSKIQALSLAVDDMQFFDRILGYYARETTSTVYGHHNYVRYFPLSKKITKENYDQSEIRSPRKYAANA